MLCTTLAAVMGSALRPVLAACSIYGWGRILNMFSSLSILWLVLPKLWSDHDYKDRCVVDLFGVVRHL